jgi:hypothetical protein
MLKNVRKIDNVPEKQSVVYPLYISKRSADGDILLACPV